MEIYKTMAFSGKNEDFPAWSTRLTAYLQTKDLYPACMGKETEPEEVAALAVGADNTAKAEHEKKVKERNGKVTAIHERRNKVWCILALCLNETSLMYVTHDCVGRDRMGDGAKAWAVLKQRFCSTEKPCIVSIMGQLARLKLDSTESLENYCIRAQSLMTRLSDAGEQLTETLFNPLVPNGLPERYE